MAHTQFSLLGTRRFAPFFVTQFLGAFNDNLFKNALVVLLTFHAASWTNMPAEILTNLAAGIFILPFFIFSATAGQLADKYDKARLARLVKVLEMLIMGVALCGFLAHSFALLLVALCLLGLHSTLFGPVKYAILPQHLGEDELVGGNALVESGTFVAILIGTLAGGVLAGIGGNPVWIALAALLVAAAGYVASLGIPAAAAPVPDLAINLNPFSETWRNIGFARREPTVFLAILGISWFWLYGALFLAQFPVYAKNVLGGDELSVTLLLAVFTVGIGVGSMLCEKLSGKYVEIGLVPLGSLGLTLFGVDLLFASPATPPAGAPLAIAAVLATPGTWRVLADLLGLGLFGGFFIVPLYVLIQLRSAPEHRARIIAANNILNALFMVVGALGAAALLAGGLSIPQLFALAALINALVAFHICRRVPEFVLRFVAWLLAHSVYRIESRGLGNVPADGPAVLICKHTGRFEPLLIAAAIRRPIRFVVDASMLHVPLIGFVLRHQRAIAIAPNDGVARREPISAQVEQALAGGELVCLVSAGGMTELPLRQEVVRLVVHLPAPVIPLVLCSLREGRLPVRVELRVGQPLTPPAANADALRARGAELQDDRR